MGKTCHRNSLATKGEACRDQLDVLQHAGVQRSDSRHQAETPARGRPQLAQYSHICALGM